MRPNNRLTSRWPRIAGLLYLVLFVTGSFPIALRTSLVERGDATKTIVNIVAAEIPFRLSIVSELVMALAWFGVAFALHLYFERHHPILSRLILCLVGIGVATICVNTVFQAGALVVATDNELSTAFGDADRAALAGLFLTLFSRGWTISGVFTGAWLLPLGWMVRASAHFPRALGSLLMLGSLAYLFPVITVFLIPSLVGWNVPVMGLAGFAELCLAVVLLIRAMPDNSLPAIDHNDPGPGQT